VRHVRRVDGVDLDHDILSKIAMLATSGRNIGTWEDCQGACLDVISAESDVSVSRDDFADPLEGMKCSSLGCIDRVDEKGSRGQHSGSERDVHVGMLMSIVNVRQ
jgi:hypothetical protein